METGLRFIKRGKYAKDVGKNRRKKPELLGISPFRVEG